MPVDLLICLLVFLTIHGLQVTLPSGETRTINFAILVAASGAWTGELGRTAGIGEGQGILSVPIPIEPRCVILSLCFVDVMIFFTG